MQMGLHIRTSSHHIKMKGQRSGNNKQGRIAQKLKENKFDFAGPVDG